MRLPLCCWPSSEEEAVASLVLLCQAMEALHGVGQGCPPARSRELGLRSPALIPWCCLTPLCPRLGAKLGAAFPAPSPSLLRTGMQPLHHPLLPAPTPSPVGADFIGCGAAPSVSSAWPGSHHEMGEGAGSRPPHRSLGYEKTCPRCSASPGSLPCGEAEPATGAGGRQPGERRETEPPPRARVQLLLPPFSSEDGDKEPPPAPALRWRGCGGEGVKEGGEGETLLPPFWRGARGERRAQPPAAGEGKPDTPKLLQGEERSPLPAVPISSGECFGVSGGCPWGGNPHGRHRAARPALTLSKTISSYLNIPSLPFT